MSGNAGAGIDLALLGAVLIENCAPCAASVAAR
jgi:hypothetical protein